MEGEESSETGFTEIVTTADSLDGSAIFHLIKDVLGFVLYMHQQIPSILQDISDEYDMLKAEYKEMDFALTQTEMKASLRRNHTSKMREVKRGIKRLDKLMNTISSLQTALQLIITEVPNVEGALLVLGSSPIRPIHVYEMSFSCGKVLPSSASDFSKTRAVEGLSKKAIRTLLSNGAGSVSYPVPTRLFLLVKAPSSVNLPLHFLPKRDFKYSRKIVPFRLRFGCQTRDKEMDDAGEDSQAGTSTILTNSSTNDLIWYQCRHVIKGLPSGLSSEE